jgi:transcriptional regulator with XRE-family HTH domain
VSDTLPWARQINGVSPNTDGEDLLVKIDAQVIAMTTALTRFGSLCRAFRSSRDRTMGEQAAALGCAIYQISDLETGRAQPTNDYIDSLSHWLNLEASECLALKKRSKSNVVSLRNARSFSNNSNSMRLFRRISRMDSTEIRRFRTKIQDEAKNE